MSSAAGLIWTQHAFQLMGSDTMIREACISLGPDYQTRSKLAREILLRVVLPNHRRLARHEVFTPDLLLTHSQVGVVTNLAVAQPHPGRGHRAGWHKVAFKIT